MKLTAVRRLSHSSSNSSRAAARLLSSCWACSRCCCKAEAALAAAAASLFSTSAGCGQDADNCLTLMSQHPCDFICWCEEMLLACEAAMKCIYRMHETAHQDKQFVTYKCARGVSDLFPPLSFHLTALQIFNDLVAIPQACLQLLHLSPETVILPQNGVHAPVTHITGVTNWQYLSEVMFHRGILQVSDAQAL